MEASEILSTERMALQLRFMQNLSSNTEGKETTMYVQLKTAHKAAFFAVIVAAAAVLRDIRSKVNL